MAVVEGPFSTMIPFDHPSALMGKVISEQQIVLLEALAESGTEEFVLGIDPDASREMYETVRKLDDRLPKVSVLRFPSGKDAFDCREGMDFYFDTRGPLRLSDRLRNLHVQQTCFRHN